MNYLDWFQFKIFLERATGLSMDALHILAGFGIFLIIAAFVRRRIASGLPLLTLLGLEIGNEAYDLSVESWPDLGMQLGEGAKDILLTMALPAILTAIARWKPSLIAADASSDNGSRGDLS